MSTSGIVAIPCANSSRHAAYLQYAWQHSEQGLPSRLKVMPTERGRRALNGFWPYWLRQLVLERGSASQRYAVELFGNYVLVAGASPEKTELQVASFAAQLQPLPQVLQPYPWNGRSYTYAWEVKPSHRYVPLAMIAEILKVPGGGRIWLSQWPGYPTLLYAEQRGRGHDLREIRQAVELQVALTQV